MSQRKFSDYQLEQLVKKGNGVSQIARKLGVSKGTVSKRLKQLKVGISKSVTLHHAGEIVKKEINAVEQLLRINENANALLDRLMRVVEGDKEELARVKPLLGGKSGIIEAALKVKSEIRAQLRLQLEMVKSLYDLNTVAEFQRIMLHEIGRVDPDVQNRIMQRLQKIQAVYSTLSLQ
jgi:transposase-like protein